MQLVPQVLEELQGVDLHSNADQIRAGEFRAVRHKIARESQEWMEVVLP